MDKSHWKYTKMFLETIGADDYYREYDDVNVEHILFIGDRVLNLSLANILSVKYGPATGSRLMTSVASNRHYRDVALLLYPELHIYSYPGEIFESAAGLIYENSVHSKMDLTFVDKIGNLLISQFHYVDDPSADAAFQKMLQDKKDEAVKRSNKVNYKGKFLELVVKRQPRLHVSHEVDGPPESPIFKFTVRADFGNIILTGNGEGLTKKDGEQYAFKDLLDKYTIEF